MVTPFLFRYCKNTKYLVYLNNISTTVTYKCKYIINSSISRLHFKLHSSLMLQFIYKDFFFHFYSSNYICDNGILYEHQKQARDSLCVHYLYQTGIDFGENQVNPKYLHMALSVETCISKYPGSLKL